MIKDFDMFHSLVSPGGFIVIDDYKTISTVRSAVNTIISRQDFDKVFYPVGSFDNFFINKSTRLDFTYREKTRFDGVLDKNNEFIIRKKW